MIANESYCSSCKNESYCSSCKKKRNDLCYKVFYLIAIAIEGAQTRRYNNPQEMKTQLEGGLLGGEERMGRVEEGRGCSEFTEKSYPGKGFGDTVVHKGMELFNSS